MSAQPARAYFGIGEVLAQLRGEFPDISVSKIRFLESEGLIEPARSPSGYRRFGPADVERLRYILTAQRDQYLPLRVIKDRLDRRRGRRQGGPRRAAAPAPAAEPAGAARRGRDRRGLPDRAGGVRPGPAVGGSTAPEALDAARIIVALGRYGVQARHLRAVRAAAERETALIEQVVAPTLRQRSPGARERAAQTARKSRAVRVHGSLRVRTGRRRSADCRRPSRGGGDAPGPPCGEPCVQADAGAMRDDARTPPARPGPGRP